MGARTLVAVERPNGRYDCYHSQWGGQHLDRLVGLLRVDGLPPTLADAGPVETAVPADRVLALLDPREYEALVVDGGSVEAYLVCWLGVEPLQHTGRADTAGTPADEATAFVRDAALVPWTDAATATRLRRFLRTAKDVLGDAVDAGLLSAPAATASLRIRLAGHPDVPADTLWLPVGGDTVA
ncbi:DUF6735 family protein [Halosimplex salinum]|uniref:DUF6735 family protein n=1 Tax=Halosimplex salinum TaxID=1710538 RepID=UPI000F4A8500|nr:DUF6735 family protein [Halosimplex salinum]